MVRGMSGDAMGQHGGRRESTSGVAPERAPDKYDAIYTRLVKAKKFDDTAEQQARRSRKVRESENE
jgi:hypothetical protein